MHLNKYTLYKRIYIWPLSNLAKHKILWCFRFDSRTWKIGEFFSKRDEKQEPTAYSLALLAIDGSTLMLPNHPTIKAEFGETNFGPNGDAPRSMARISMLYDCLNLTTLDAQMDTYDTSERELAMRHMPLVKPGTDLLIMDRGYPSFALFHELQQTGIDYCVRWRENWWKDVAEMLETGEADKVVTIKGELVFEMWPLRLYNKEITCRIVVVELPGGGKEVLVTSLLDSEKFPYETFVKLYEKRWTIEEGYKFYKTRLQLEAW